MNRSPLSFTLNTFSCQDNDRASSENKATAPKKHEKSLAKLFLVAMYGLTGGIFVGQALNPKVMWLTHLTLPLPLLTWCIHSYKTDHGYLCPLVRKVDDTSRLLFLSFFVFGILGSFFVNFYASPFCQAVYSDDLQKKILFFQGALYFGAELSAFILRLFKRTEPSNHTSHSNYRVNHLTSETEQIHNSWIYRFLTSFMSPNLPSSSDFKAEDLIPVIEKLKDENRRSKENIEELMSFLNSDSELVNSFNAGYEKNKKKLLKPYVMGKSEVQDPIIRQWGEESLLGLYYEGMFTRFIDFLTKNPQFADLFKEKLKNAGQQAILEKLS